MKTQKKPKKVREIVRKISFSIACRFKNNSYMRVNRKKL